ncbi:unnamed protein product, partial [Mesorhabditis belari]|uniref:CRAL-TRIO domain-containing protein n=1 Tax=Mesorhabditis belari TaxID=2138241 RepID=A0AAF3EMQ6_9BILA
MPEEPSTAADIEVAQVREAVKDLIHPKYDTYFNILRWIQGTNHNVPKAIHMLRKHLKWRKEKRLDTDSSTLQSCKIASDHAPLCIIKPTNPDADHILVVDQAGKIDVGGVLKSVQPTDYIHQKYRNIEKILSILMEMEARLGRQCYAYYIFDLDGLSFDPTMVGTVTGPFRISWELMAMHYREWIDKFIVINAPGFMNILWSAISPFIPEDGRGKIVFPGKSWRDDLQELLGKESLPEKYGGTLKDSEVLTAPEPVPKEKYWSPKVGEPNHTNLHKISIPASKERQLLYPVKAGEKLIFYTQNDSELMYGIAFTTNKDLPEEDWDILVPPCPRAGLPAIDAGHFEPMDNGYYQLRIQNQAAWLFPSTFKILALSESGKEIFAENQGAEKWFKAGQKFKK